MKDKIKFKKYKSFEYESEVECFISIILGNEEKVKKYIAAGFDVNYKDAGGRTALSLATQYGHVNIVRMLLENGANITYGIEERLSVSSSIYINPEKYEILKILRDYKLKQEVKKGFDRLSPRMDFFKSVISGSEEMVEGYIDKGFDINSVSRNGNTALSLAIQYGHHNIVQILLNSGVNTKFNPEDKIDSSIITAIEYGQKEILETLIEYRPEQNTELLWHEAIRLFASTVILDYILSIGPYLYSLNANGDNALFEAARLSEPIIIDYLIDRGLSPNLTNSIGQTPIFVAANYGLTKNVETLIERGARLDIVDENGDNVLFFVACDDCYEEVATLLIAKGAEVNQVNNRGQTPIFVAVNYGMLDLVEFLIQCGAEVDVVDDFGRNLLFYIVDFDNFEGDTKSKLNLIKLLIYEGVPIDSRDNEDKTLLSYAVRLGDKKILKVLTSHFTNFSDSESEDSFTEEVEEIDGQQELTGDLKEIIFDGSKEA